MKIHFLNLCNSILFSVIFSDKLGTILNTDGEESSSTQSRIRRYENILKKPSDKRLYRGLQLENDLKILLISNPNLERASAAMSVGAGSLNDDDLPGTANFVGEILNRMGTSTNPEQGFAEILNSRLNPADLQLAEVFPETFEDTQLFYFSVNAGYLAPTLEIFSQFFNEPLLLTSNSRSQLEGYIEELEWMYASAVLEDYDNKWQLYQLQKSMSVDGHPFNNLSHGHPEKFTEYLVEEVMSNELEPQLNGSAECPTKLQDKLRKFHSTWYSSNIMCLVVFGRDSLDELERMTVPLFQNIPNKHIDRLTFSYKQHPWGQEQLRRKIYTEFPDDDYADKAIVVRLVFRVPDIRHHYKTAPELYVMEFFKAGGVDSLVPPLRNRKPCTYLKTQYNVYAGIGFFTIKCKTPVDSEPNEDEMVEFILRYIHSLRKNGIREWVFKEIIRRKNMAFSNTSHAESIESIARAMQVYPMNDVLLYKSLQNEWKSSLVEEFLSYLTPENMNVFIDGEKFQNVTAELKMSPLYNIPHKIKVIPDQLIERWKTVDVFPEFLVPQQNEFLVENFGIHPLIEDEPESPYVVYKSSRSQFWFLQSNQSTNIRIKFNIYVLKGSWNSSSSVLFCIFSKFLSRLITEYKYNLRVSGYEWNIPAGENFVEITLFRYSDKIQTVLRRIISKITAENLTGSHLQEQFEKAKSECIIQCERFIWDYPQVMQRLKYLLTEPAGFWSLNEMIEALRFLQFKDWEKFVIRMWSNVYLQGLIFGNCTKHFAIDIVKIIETPFGVESTGLIPQEKSGLLPRVVEIEKGSFPQFVERLDGFSTDRSEFTSILLHPGKHFISIIFSGIRDEKTHLHYTYYQFGHGTHRNIIISTLFLNMTSKKCRSIQNELRMQSIIFKTYSVIGLLLWTYPTHLHPDHVDLQFENCLKNVHESLQEMTAIEFEEYVKSVINNELHFLPSSLRLWDDISGGFYPNVLEDDMKPVSKAEVLTFLEDNLKENSPNRRKFTMLLFHKDSEWTSMRPLPGTIKIEDVMTFKNDSYLSPLPLSFMSVNFAQQEEAGT